MRRSWPSRIIAFAIVFFLSPTTFAREQDHTCQGGHNCNSGGTPGNTTVDASAISVAASSSYATAEAGSVGDVSTGDQSNSQSVTNNLSLFGNAGEGGADLNQTSSSEGGGNILSPSTNVQVTSRIPKQIPGTVLYMNNNTESCVRVFGLSFANDQASSMLGVPLPRSKPCDLWKAVNEAQENGHTALSYAFMCQIKNIKKTMLLTPDGERTCLEMTVAAMDQIRVAVEVATLEGKH